MKPERADWRSDQGGDDRQTPCVLQNLAPFEAVVLTDSFSLMQINGTLKVFGRKNFLAKQSSILAFLGSLTDLLINVRIGLDRML